jgi:hypothetical protein
VKIHGEVKMNRELSPEGKKAYKKLLEGFADLCGEEATSLKNLKEDILTILEEEGVDLKITDQNTKVKK